MEAMISDGIEDMRIEGFRSRSFLADRKIIYYHSIRLSQADNSGKGIAQYAIKRIDRRLPFNMEDTCRMLMREY